MILVVDVDSPDSLDDILLTLPLMVELGQFVDVKVTALRRYENFADTLNRLLQQGEASASSSAG